MTSRYDRSSRRGNEAESSKSLLQNSYLSDEQSKQVSKDMNAMWALSSYSEAVMVGSHSYTARWIMDGRSLRKWIQSELLYASRSKTMMNGPAYVNKYQGVYTHKWTAEEGYVINLGPPEILVDLVEIRQDDFLGVISAGKMEPKKVRIDFDIDVIKLPLSYYAPVQSTLKMYGFETVAYGNGRSQIRGKCSNLEFLQSYSQSLTITSVQLFELTRGNQLFRIDPTAYTIMGEDFCTIQIEKSEDETLILGTPLLRAVTVVVKNRGDELIYFASKETHEIRVVREQ